MAQFLAVRTTFRVPDGLLPASMSYAMSSTKRVRDCSANSSAATTALCAHGSVAADCMPSCHAAAETAATARPRRKGTRNRGSGGGRGSARPVGSRRRGTDRRRRWGRERRQC